MRMRAVAVGLVAVCLAVGCAQSKPSDAAVETEKPELTPELKSLVLDEAPTDIPHPLYVDFNGRAELLGYSLEPAVMAPPGSKLALKLYWRSTARLETGYLPYTELVLANGKRIEVAGGGPVRSGALAPPSWEPGKVYVDELEISVPADIDAARFAIVVGLKTQPIAAEEPAAVAEKNDDKKADKTAEKPGEGTFGAVYLSVLSGPADSKHGAAIATLETGATRGAQRLRTAKDDKRNADALKRLPIKPGAGKPVAGRPVAGTPAPGQPARPAQPAQ
jgi:hypothetical protein